MASLFGQVPDADWVVPAIQISFQLATAIAVDFSLSPPNPPVKSEDCCSGTKGTETLFERFVQSVTYLSKSMCWIGVLCNVLHLFWRILLYSPDNIFEVGEAEMPTETPVIHAVHPVVIIGTIAAIAGAILRTWQVLIFLLTLNHSQNLNRCFRTLGPLFTFEITIRPKHELITHGPYAWVRHPSYTGIYLTLGGATLVLGSPDSWTSTHLIRTPVGAALALFWAFKCCFAFRGMCVRFRAEDEVLRKTFGAEWEDYADRVPYKFISGVI